MINLNNVKKASENTPQHHADEIIKWVNGTRHIYARAVNNSIEKISDEYLQEMIENIVQEQAYNNSDDDTCVLHFTIEGIPRLFISSSPHHGTELYFAIYYGSRYLDGNTQGLFETGSIGDQKFNICNSIRVPKDINVLVVLEQQTNYKHHGTDSFEIFSDEALDSYYEEFAINLEMRLEDFGLQILSHSMERGNYKDTEEIYIKVKHPLR